MLQTALLALSLLLLGTGAWVAKSALDIQQNAAVEAPPR